MPFISLRIIKKTSVDFIDFILNQIASVMKRPVNLEILNFSSLRHFICWNSSTIISFLVIEVIF